MAAVLRNHVTALKHTLGPDYNFFVNFVEMHPVPVLLDTGSSVNTITRELSNVALKNGTVEPLPHDLWRRYGVPRHVKLADGTSIPVHDVVRTTTNDTTAISPQPATTWSRRGKHEQEAPPARRAAAGKVTWPRARVQSTRRDCGPRGAYLHPLQWEGSGAQRQDPK